jgi:hypothetical protein
MFPGREGFDIALARILAAAPEAAARDGQRALTVLQALSEPVQRTLEFGMVTAMALAETGRFDEAASLQQQVIQQLPGDAGDAMRNRMADLLRSYQQRRPIRQPWAREEPMELIDIQQAPS